MFLRLAWVISWIIPRCPWTLHGDKEGVHANNSLLPRSLTSRASDALECIGMVLNGLPGRRDLNLLPDLVAYRLVCTPLLSAAEMPPSSPRVGHRSTCHTACMLGESHRKTNRRDRAAFPRWSPGLYCSTHSVVLRTVLEGGCRHARNVLECASASSSVLKSARSSLLDRKKSGVISGY